MYVFILKKGIQTELIRSFNVCLLHRQQPIADKQSRVGGGLAFGDEGDALNLISRN